MTAERFAFRVAVYLLLIRDGHILLSRRHNTGWMDGMYSMVAGHVDGNESVSSALAREAMEEANLVIDTKTVRVVHTMHRKCADDLEYIDFFADAAGWTGEPMIMEPDKCDDISWFELDALPCNILDYVRYAIENTQNGITYSEFGWF